MTTEKPKKERIPKPKRPRNLSPASAQRYELEQLLAKPDQEIIIPGVGDAPQLLPPDILLNIQGSSAGAGSGEFHVYKASRKREFERIAKMEEEVHREESEQEFMRERAAKERRQADKTAKNRKRRDKKKGRKTVEEDGTKEVENGTTTVEKADIKVALKVVPPKRADVLYEEKDVEEEEEYEEREVPDGLLVIDDD
jgi:Protein of unknown function (DUF1168)